MQHLVEIFKPTFCDMAPRLAGVLHGIGDACYSAGGFVVPLMINAMITDDPYLIRLRDSTLTDASSFFSVIVASFFGF